MGWWKLDESSGNTASDSFSDKDGVLSDDLSFSSNSTGGAVGDALTFDGDDLVDQIGGVSDYSFIQNQGVFTISVWMKKDDLNTDATDYIVANQQSSGQKGFEIRYDDRSSVSRNQRMVATLARGGAHTVILTSNDNAITTTDWNHIVFTADGTNANLYVNGTSVVNTVLGTLSSGASTNPVQIGANGNGAGNFTGYIDDLRIYSRALSLGEIRKLHQLGF